MPRLTIILAVIAVAALVLGAMAACAPLATFNALTPKDDAKLVVANVRYGEGPRRTLDIYSAGAKNAPVIVFIYGGSWSDGRKDDYGFAGRAFAARGFIVVIADYRLVPEIAFPGFIEDGAAAVAWTQKHIAAYGGDPRRIVLAGHSAGAYNAMMIALNGAYLKKAGADPSAIRGVAGISGPYDFYPFDVKASMDAFGKAADPRATQPISFVRADAPPLLLLHGDMDTIVRPRNTLSLSAKQKEAGGQVETRIYAGLKHADPMLALSRPFRGKAPVLDDVTAFARRVTAAAP
jgi:acetyl esterase/lipase